MHKTYKINKK